MQTSIKNTPNSDKRAALTAFHESLPPKPYVSHDLSCLTIRSREKAVFYPYIQPNPPLSVTWLVFDIDRGNQSFFAYDDAMLPEPNMVCQNPANGNCHMFYWLVKPVWTEVESKAYRYFKAIRMAYTGRIQADPCYTGLICKNPLNSQWRTTELHYSRYTLDDLAKHVELQPERIEKATNAEQFSLGRNCSLFEALRYFSYAKVNDYRELNIGRAYDMWLKAVESEAAAINGKFSQALPFNEVRATAKSVAKWTWNNYQPAENKQRGVMGYGETRHNFNFSALYLPEEVKRKRQQEAAKRTNEIRKAETEAKITAAIAELKAKNLKVTKAEVAKMTGLERAKLSQNYKHMF